MRKWVGALRNPLLEWVRLTGDRVCEEGFDWHPIGACFPRLKRPETGDKDTLWVWNASFGVASVITGLAAPGSRFRFARRVQGIA